MEEQQGSPLKMEEQLITAEAMILLSATVAIVWAYINFCFVKRVTISGAFSDTGESSALLGDGDGRSASEIVARLTEIYEAIYEGAESFLTAEYRVCTQFVVAFTILVFILIGIGTEWDTTRAGLSALSFALGAFTSMASGYLGMKVAVFSNVRTTVSATPGPEGWTRCFNVAFRAGAVMGFALCGLGILVLYGTAVSYKVFVYPNPDDWVKLTECMTGYGLGGSCIAMFGRVGGGIYTKAADVGADLVGKVSFILLKFVRMGSIMRLAKFLDFNAYKGGSWYP